jgi:O-antigen/teichoic acid export membrane protein
VAAELVSKALQPLIFVLLARLLTPIDYGVAAAAVMVISFTQIFWEFGMAKALIQRQQQVDDAANAAFWINLAMAMVFALVLYTFADTIARVMFQDERVGDVLMVMTVQIILGALGSVQTALLQREMKFDRLFWLRLATVGVPGLFSIPLAWYGYSYWALIIGTIAGQAVQVAVLWGLTPWRPRFSFNVAVAKDLSRFGLWVCLTGLLTWFFLWVDSLIVGSYLGTQQLGLYRTGSQFVIMAYGLLFAPLLPVLYSHFSNINEGAERLRQAFTRVVRVITLISVPFAFLIGALANPVTTVVLGEQWKGVEFVLMVMALMQGYSWVVGVNGEVYRAIGKPSYETVVTSIMLGVYLLGYYISIRQGFEIFVWTRFGLSLVALALHLLFAWIAIKISISLVVRTILLATLIGLIAPGVNWLVGQWIGGEAMLQGLVTGLVSAVLMAIALFIFERNHSIKDVLNLLKQKTAPL